MSARSCPSNLSVSPPAPAEHQPVKAASFSQLVVGAAAFLLLGSWAVVGLAVAAGRQWSGAGVIDPFAGYETIMPGQPVAHLEAFSCENPSVFVTPHSRLGLLFVCHDSRHDESGRLAQAVAVDGVIRQFTAEVSGLYLGDLALRWGLPNEIHRTGLGCIVGWFGRIYAVTAQCSASLYKTPVQRIIIGDPEAVLHS